MSRVKRGTAAHKRKKRLLSEAKGYYGARRTQIRKARETVLRAGAFAYRDRKTRKRVIRSLWITRINAAARLSDLSYNQFMHGLKLASVDLDRKVLADMAVRDQDGFRRIAEIAKAHLAKKRERRADSVVQGTA
jgi:large subunit ribosomal protein L20